MTIGDPNILDVAMPSSSQAQGGDGRIKLRAVRLNMQGKSRIVGSINANNAAHKVGKIDWHEQGIRRAEILPTI